MVLKKTRNVLRASLCKGIAIRSLCISMDRLASNIDDLRSMVMQLNHRKVALPFSKEQRFFKWGV
jgi:hypothetical protein